ncbi:hypothetical protein UFOVP209_7 [uncultured Caudovirales phage]|uniref:Uncharacterized protein n=1 Tax=uncultured Caudovirales phage TaxID=2100421 RepID=A0A6J7WI46_9CAUD|nr:hypothetical protein UFOVP209_7 [uncultured Caudovirales phage]
MNPDEIIQALKYQIWDPFAPDIPELAAQAIALIESQRSRIQAQSDKIETLRDRLNFQQVAVETMLSNAVGYTPETGMA